MWSAKTVFISEMAGSEKVFGNFIFGRF